MELIFLTLAWLQRSVEAISVTLESTLKIMKKLRVAQEKIYRNQSFMKVDLAREKKLTRDPKKR